jgi:hypothetical protein
VSQNTHSITALLGQWRGGHKKAGDRNMKLVYAELQSNVTEGNVSPRHHKDGGRGTAGSRIHSDGLRAGRSSGNNFGLCAPDTPRETSRPGFSARITPSCRNCRDAGSSFPAPLWPLPRSTTERLGMAAGFWFVVSSREMDGAGALRKDLRNRTSPRAE